MLPVHCNNVPIYCVNSAWYTCLNTMYPFPGTIYCAGTLDNVLRLEQCALNTHLTASCPLGVSSPTLLPLTNTAHCCSPTLIYPNPGLFAQKLRGKNTRPAGNMELANCSPPPFICPVLQMKFLQSTFRTLEAFCTREEKEFVFCSISFKDKVALSSMFEIPAFRYIRGKSPHLTLMILGLTQYKCFPVNF